MKYIEKNFEACEVVAYEEELAENQLDKEALLIILYILRCKVLTCMTWSRVLALSKILKSGCLKNRVESVAIVGVGWNILIIHNMW